MNDKVQEAPNEGERMMLAAVLFQLCFASRRHLTQRRSSQQSPASQGALHGTLLHVKTLLETISPYVDKRYKEVLQASNNRFRAHILSHTSVAVLCNFSFAAGLRCVNDVH